MSLDIVRISDSERLARFLFDRGDFNGATGTVRARPLLPAPNENARSVFRTDGLVPDAVWQLASPRNEREAKAFASFTGGQVRMARLDAVPDEPPPRHALITNWPAKDARLACAQYLASLAVLHVKASPRG